MIETGTLQYTLPDKLLNKDAETYRFVVWGDLQAHPWQESRRADAGKDLVRVINTVYEIANQASANGVVFLGDLFESKRAVRTDYASRIIQQINYRALCSRDAYIWNCMVEGNHDRYNGRSMLNAFNYETGVSDGETNFSSVDDVYSKPTICRIKSHAPNKFSIAFIPYECDPKSGLKDFCNAALHDGIPLVAFSHCQISGSVMGESVIGGKLVERGTTTLPAGIRNGKTVIFNGHYHRPGTLTLPEGNQVVFVGSPMQYNWTDIDSGDRGIVVVDILPNNKVEWRRVWFNGTPRFYSAENKDQATSIDFVREVDVEVTGAPSVRAKGASVSSDALTALTSSDLRVAFDEWLDAYCEDATAKRAVMAMPRLREYLEAVITGSDLSTLRSMGLREKGDDT